MKNNQGLKKKLAYVLLSAVLVACSVFALTGFKKSAATDATERPLYSVSGLGSAEYKTVQAYNEYLSEINKGAIDGVTLESYDVTFPYTVKDDGVYEDVTGVIVSLRPNSKLLFNKVVDLSKLSKFDPIITLACLPNQVGSLDMKRINVKVTDIYDSSKYLIFKVKEHEVGDGDYIGYTMVSVCSELNECYYYTKYASLTYGKDAVISFKGRPGCSAKGKVVYKDALSRAAEGLSFSYDNDYGVVYQNDVRDNFSLLCDTKAAAAFEGFTTGEVVIEVYADRYVASTANFVVKNFAGLDLSKNVTDDVGPFIAVDCDENNVTLGKVGYKYPFYSAKAYDKFNGEVECGKVVYKNYYSDNAIAIASDADGFVPDSAGVYTICYFASDSYGDVSEKTVDVTVVKDGYDLAFALNDKTVAAIQGQKVALAEFEATSGLGEVAYTVTVRQGNEEIEVNDNSFIPLKTGDYTVTYTAKDFVGQTKSDSYTVKVSANSEPLIADNLDVKLYKNFILGSGTKNYSYPLDKVYAYNFSDAGYEKVETTVTVDNGTIENGVYTPERAGAVTFTYSCGGKVAGTASREVYKVTRTVDGDVELDVNKMFLSVGDIETGYSENSGSKYLVKNDAAYLEYLNPVIAEDMSFDFLTEKNHNEVGKVNFILTDVNNPAQSIKLTFTKSSTKAYFNVNGGSMSEVNCSFSGEARDVFKFSLKATTRAVVVGGNSYTIDNYLSGKPFAGFDSYKVNVKITFEGVDANGFAFVVKNMSAQAFNLDVVKDTTKPIIKFFGEDGGLKNRGDKVTLPVAIAADVLSPVLKNFTLTVANKDEIVKDVVTGKELLNVEPMQYVVSLDNYGEYTFTYTATDLAGKTQISSFVISVFDLVAPTVEIVEKTKVVSGSVNNRINIADVTVSDNTCAANDITVNVFVQAPGSAPKLVKEKYFTPEKAGKYTVYFYVYDKVDNEVNYSQGNVTVLSYTVTVK